MSPRFHLKVFAALEIAFETRSLRELCESEQKAVRKLGVSAARILKARLADLRAATSVMDIVVTKPTEVGRANPRHMALKLSTGARMTFSANHIKVPSKGMGQVDWAKVSRIKIMSVEIAKE